MTIDKIDTRLVDVIEIITQAMKVLKEICDTPDQLSFYRSKATGMTLCLSHLVALLMMNDPNLLLQVEKGLDTLIKVVHAEEIKGKSFSDGFQNLVIPENETIH